MKAGQTAGWLNEAETPTADVATEYIISGKSGPETKFYCESATQGGRMVPNAYSMAYAFSSEEEANRKLLHLQAFYKGITEWKVTPKTE